MLLCKAAAILMLLCKAAAIPMLYCTVFRFRMVSMQFGIQHFRSMRIRFQIQTMIEKNLQLTFFFIRNYKLLIPRPPYRTTKLQEKPSALKREHRALQNLKFLYMNLCVACHFCPPGSGLIQPKSMQIHANTKQWLCILVITGPQPVRRKIQRRYKTNMEKSGSISVAFIINRLASKESVFVPIFPMERAAILRNFSHSYQSKLRLTDW
jgi:hypothetical protein